MADSRAKTEKVQDEPRASYYARKQERGQEMMDTCQEDIGANRRSYQLKGRRFL